MRALLSETFAASSPAADGAWRPGLPHAAAALASWPLLGGAACATGMLMAGLVSFVVWLPLTALALNRGAALPDGGNGPMMTPAANRILFVLWTATAWAAAVLSR